MRCIRVGFHFVLAVLACLLMLNACSDKSTDPDKNGASDGAGLIVVSIRPEGIGASWTLDGPGNYMASGVGDSMLIDCVVGEYTMTWNPMENWTTPPNVTLDLTANDTITFVGIYVKPAAWSVMSHPAISELDLRDVYFRSPTSGWACGTKDGEYNYDGVILRCTGDDWEEESLPYIQGDWSVNGLHFVSDSEGWAVGSANDRCVILHYFGGTWTQIASPVTAPLSGVYFISPEEGWAVGGLYSTVILKYAEGQWSNVEVQGGPGRWRVLTSVYFAGPTEGWAVGKFYDGEEYVFIAYYDGSTWDFSVACWDQDPGGTRLSSVFCLPGGTCWTVGWPNVVLRRDPGSPCWKQIDSGESPTDIFFLSESDGWMTAARYVPLYKWNSEIEGWENVYPTGGSPDLYSLFFLDGNTGWAVGGGFILRYN